MEDQSKWSQMNGGDLKGFLQVCENRRRRNLNYSLQTFYHTYIWNHIKHVRWFGNKKTKKILLQRHSIVSGIQNQLLSRRHLE